MSRTDGLCPGLTGVCPGLTGACPGLTGVSRTDGCVSRTDWCVSRTDGCVSGRPAENTLLRPLMKYQPPAPSVPLDCSVPDVQYRTVSALACLFDKELGNFIGWAKQLPGKTRTAAL